MVSVNLSSVQSKAELHAEFSRAFNFPSYYGANWDAWIDCMSDLTLLPGEVLLVEINSWEIFSIRLPIEVLNLTQSLTSLNAQLSSNRNFVAIVLR